MEADSRNMQAHCKVAVLIDAQILPEGMRAGDVPRQGEHARLQPAAVTIDEVGRRQAVRPGGLAAARHLAPLVDEGARYQNPVRRELRQQGPEPVEAPGQPDIVGIEEADMRPRGGRDPDIAGMRAGPPLRHPQHPYPLRGQHRVGPRQIPVRAIVHDDHFDGTLGLAKDGTDGSHKDGGSIIIWNYN